MVTTALSDRDTPNLIQAATRFQQEMQSALGQRAPAVVSLAMGENGKLSRVLNRVFTPVTHPLLPSSAAPGQLSVKEIQALRFSLGAGIP